MFSGLDVNTQTSSLGGIAPSGNVIDGGVVDMSSFYVLWNGSDIAQGSGIASVTAIAGGYQLAWTAQQSGPKLSPLTQWTIDISEVPLPASSWLLLSGLLGLVSFSR